MSNRLELPADLISLIEKRELEDRRVSERRTEQATSSDMPADRRDNPDRRDDERRSVDGS